MSSGELLRNEEHDIYIKSFGFFFFVANIEISFTAENNTEAVGRR